LLSAVLLHVLFFRAFKAQSPQASKQPGTRSEPDCVLLSPDRQGWYWEKELRAWCKIADPTLLSLPNETLGFSSVRHQGKIEYYTGAPVFLPQVPLASEASVPELPVNLGLEVSEAIRKTWPIRPPQMPLALPPSRLPETVLWRLSDGTPLKDLPNYSKEQVLEVVKTLPPAGATRIEVVKSWRLLRFRVVQSCGNRDLDMLALGDLKEKLQPLSTGSERALSAELESLLPMVDGESHTVEVEWRLSLSQEKV
jgi:hypothetical protein